MAALSLPPPGNLSGPGASDGWAVSQPGNHPMKAETPSRLGSVAKAKQLARCLPTPG